MIPGELEIIFIKLISYKVRARGRSKKIWEPCVNKDLEYLDETGNMCHARSTELAVSNLDHQWASTIDEAELQYSLFH